MLVEVNAPRFVIVVAPPASETAANLDSWHQLTGLMRFAILTRPGESMWWSSQSLPGSPVVIDWDTAPFLSPLQANVKAALEALDAQPYESILLFYDADDIQEALATRLGTILIGRPTDRLPDYFVKDLPEAVAAVRGLRSNSPPGYFGEVATTVISRGRPLASRGKIFPRFPQAMADLSSRTSVRALGRYFAKADARAKKHQLTARILRLKRQVHVHDRYLASVVGGALDHIHQRQALTAITRVPPRPSATIDNLGTLLTDALHGRPLAPFLELALLQSARDREKQRDLSAVDREANVAGAFECSHLCDGAHVLLFDDVLTTGNTAAECARALLRSGASRVTVIVLGADQNALAAPHYARLCVRPGCTGVMRIRFNSGNNGCFWGCSEFPDCGRTAVWETVLNALNEQNSRDQLITEGDISF